VPERLALVLVVAAPPDAGLVASLGGAVEPLVHSPEAVQSARIRGISVVNNAVLERERAHPRPLADVGVRVGAAHGSELTRAVGRRARRYLRERFLALEVVFDAFALFLLRERGAEVGIEIGAGRGRPGKGPAHSTLELLQLRQRRPRYRPEHHVMIGQVNCNPVESVRDRRARRTSRFVVGPEHEMVDEELRASSEEISEGRFSVVSLETVFFVDSHPRHFLPFSRHLIAPPSKILLRLEQLQPCRQPLSCRAVASRRLVTCSSLILRHRFLFFHLVGHRLFVYFACVVSTVRISALRILRKARRLSRRTRAPSVPCL